MVSLLQQVLAPPGRIGFSLVGAVLCLTACSAPTPVPPTATRPPPTGVPATATVPPPTGTVPPPTATPFPTVVSVSPVPTLAGPTATATPHPAAAAIYAYLEARALADMSLATSLVCDAYRSQATTEVVSFRSMNARLEGVTCTVTAESAAGALVNCTGIMVTTYGGETRDWDLSSFVYQAVPEDAGWKMCGYE